MDLVFEFFAVGCFAEAATIYAAEELTSSPDVRQHYFDIACCMTRERA
jgi:hypothetical protein